MLSLSFLILCHLFCIPLGDVGHNLLRLITSSTVSPMQTIDFFSPFGPMLQLLGAFGIVMVYCEGFGSSSVCSERSEGLGAVLE